MTVFAGNRDVLSEAALIRVSSNCLAACASSARLTGSGVSRFEERTVYGVLNAFTRHTSPNG